MASTVIATYLPVWRGRGGARSLGLDEDAVTLAVAAGLAAREAAGRDALVHRVVLVTRQPALLEGGNGPVLAAGLDLPTTTEVVESLGSSPAAIDAICSATPGTLAIGVDATPEHGSGAGAMLIGYGGPPLRMAGRIQRSLPVRTRSIDEGVHEVDDARFARERGLRASLDMAALEAQPVAIAGVAGKDTARLVADSAPEVTTTGASSPFFILAALADNGRKGIVAAVEQAALSAGDFDPTGVVVRRDERDALDVPSRRTSPGPEVKIALTAYDRAFDSKVRWQAGRCRHCATLSLPPRRHCLGCGAEASTDLVPLPRTGEVHTMTTVHTPVPGLPTPYSLAVVQLDGVDVRSLMGVTDSPPGRVGIGRRGTAVLRRVLVRSGVPDYGYAFSPSANDGAAS